MNQNRTTAKVVSGIILAVIVLTGCRLLVPEIKAKATVRPVDLRCEYLKDPLGVDVAKPRLSWKLEAGNMSASGGSAYGGKSEITRSMKQTAYQILVASSEELLKQDQGDLWDSGKVESDQCIQVEYAGKPLASRMVCFWKVRVWNQAENESAWSQPSFWSMGLLKPEDWQAKWIGCDESDNKFKSAKWIWFPEGNPEISAPAGERYFRGKVILPYGKKVKKALCIMTVDNQYELFINGNSAGRSSNYTDLKTFEVGSFLKEGANSIAVLAANSAPGPAGLIACLRVFLDDGSSLNFVSDGTWKTSKDKIEGWEQPAYSDEKWSSAQILGDFGMAPWGDPSHKELHPRLSARHFRKEFASSGEVKRATAYVCGLGFFDMYLNGRRISDHIVDPVLSDYRKTAYYVIFDVTSEIAHGTNAIGVVVGNGRFFSTRPWSVNYGHPKLIVQIEIQYRDNTVQQIVSDESWRLTTEGPIIANNEFDGEEYDARRELTGWDVQGYNDSSWQKPMLVSACASLSSQMMEPMRITKVIKPREVTNPKPGVYIVDMGETFYGTVRIKGRAPRGTEVFMTSAYSLQADGMLKTADNRSALATDKYIFKGEGEETWNPRFKGQGFRRVQVTGFPGTLTVDNFEGLVIHTDMPAAGAFECSNDLINRIHAAHCRGMKSYMRSAPLDPDRDERQPWLGDPAKDSESEAYNFNVAAFYTKWMDDIRRSQRVDGTIPDVSMNYDYIGGENVEWPSVFTIIPEWYLDFYGDRRLAERNYEAMKKWVLAMKRHQQPDGTLKATRYGDWCDVSTMDREEATEGSTPGDLISTAYHYNDCRIMWRLAKLFGKSDDEKIFQERAESLKTAFNKKFFNTETKVYGNGTQCSYVLPLVFGLTPPEHKKAAVDNLVHDILVTNKGHLSVGLIGMQWLMQTLTDVGRSDVAWVIASQTTRPSWGYMISKGATTIWERWNYDTSPPGMNSENLLMLAGNLDAWFYQALAGIRPDSDGPGFKKFIIRPEIVGEPPSPRGYGATGLTWVKAHHDSQYGRIVSNWKREGGKLTMDVIIPPNTTATVYVPAKNAASVTESGKPIGKVEGVKCLRLESGAAVYEVGSGQYSFGSSL